MGEWDGFLTDDYAVVEEAGASVAYTEYVETEVVVVETEVVEEVHVVEFAEVTEVSAVSEVSFESYLSVSETETATGMEAEGFAGASYDSATEDSGFSHDDSGDAGYDVWS